MFPIARRCVNQRCFETASDKLADLIVFTSAPILWERFVAILDASMNSNTGRKYGGGDSGLDGSWAVDEIPALTAGGCAEVCAEYST